jgi:hypothetical protein
MVSSSVITVATDGEHLTCGRFSLGKPIHLGNFEFITDYFSSLSLSLGAGGGGSSTTFIGSTPHWESTLWRAIIEDSIE